MLHINESQQVAIPEPLRFNQAWWDTIAHNADRFFELGSGFSHDSSPMHQLALLRDLGEICRHVEQLPYPPQAATARRHLLEAMWNLRSALHRRASGDFTSASFHIQASRAQLDAMQAALDALDVA